MLKESKFQTLFNQYLREKRMYGFYELKVAKGGTFNLKSIEKHQYEGLHAGERTGLVWKLSDEDRRQKPCDTLCIPPLQSFIVVLFGSSIHIIPFHKIENLKSRKEFSITKEQSEKLAQIVIHI